MKCSECQRPIARGDGGTLCPACMHAVPWDNGRKLSWWPSVREGRPKYEERMQTTAITLTCEHVATAALLGGGNVSAGVRRALEAAMGAIGAEELAEVAATRG